MKPQALNEHYEQLAKVTTLAGAARLVGKPCNQISMAIDLGYIAARRDGRNVLVSVPSLFDYFKTQSTRKTD